MCPFCGKNAPIVYRGVLAYCTACGRPRLPLSGESVNLAGQPSKVGGTVAHVFGWLVLGGGLLVALLVGALLLALFPGAAVGWIFGAVIALASLAVGLSLARAGKTLEKSGTRHEQSTRAQAVFAMAETRGGMLSAMDVAQSLSLPPHEAEALLTELAKVDSDRVKLEVDDNGAMYFLFPHAIGEGSVAPGRGPRVDVRPARTPSARPPSASFQGSRAEVIDAEFIEETPRRQRRS